MTDSFTACVVALYDDIVEEGKEDLPQHGLPSLRLQYRAVRGDRREQSLTGTLSNRRASVETKVLELTVEAHPELIERRNVFASGEGKESLWKDLLVARVLLSLQTECENMLQQIWLCEMQLLSRKWRKCFIKIRKKIKSKNYD